jgi:hypothetical protein
MPSRAVEATRAQDEGEAWPQERPGIKTAHGEFSDGPVVVPAYFGR